MKLKMLAPWKESYDKLRQHIKKQRNHFADKGPYSQSYGFSIVVYGWMWELDHKEGWEPKNRCLSFVMLEKTPESPLDSKEIKPVNPKGNQLRIYIERNMLKLKLQYFGHLCEEPTYWKRPWIWERLKANGEGCSSTMGSVDMSLSKLRKIVEDRGVWPAAVHGAAESQTWLRHWTTTTNPQLRITLWVYANILL